MDAPLKFRCAVHGHRFRPFFSLIRAARNDIALTRFMLRGMPDDAAVNIFPTNIRTILPFRPGFIIVGSIMQMFHYKCQGIFDFPVNHRR